MKHHNFAPRVVGPVIAIFVFAAALVALPSAATPPPDSPTQGLVRIDTGWLRGETTDDHRRFTAIPYASPPVGERRWRPPAPPERWHEIRDATTPSPWCPQRGVDGQEDCLYLDVTVPRDVERGQRLPVFVWLHGGGFSSGGARAFDGARLAVEGRMMVVTANYRLGALGFLAHRRYGLSGNFGLMDQAAALRWVGRNAATFGGDPENVTLAGQSAGARSICAQLASPMSRGLFDRAILQSGACDNAVPTVRAARSWAERAADDLGCADVRNVATCLRQVPVDRLLPVLSNEGIDNTRRVRDRPWNPIVGGPLVPRQPSAVIRNGTGARVPLLVGSTRDEMRGFVSNEAPLTAADYRARISDAFGDRAHDVLRAYPATDYETPALALATVLTDWGGQIGSCPVLRTARSARPHQPVFAYEFTESTDDRVNGLPLGSFHGMELPYLWDLDLVYNPYPGITTPQQQALSETMIQYWSAFARTGDPNGPGRPTWPSFDEDDTVVELASDGIAPTPYAVDHRCGFWEDLPS